MAKQLNVNLAFNADTSQAKAAIQSLISDLNKLGKGQSNSSLPLTQEILEAQSAAKQLGQILDKSFNKDVGKLDLTTFNQSLRSSGMTLEQYSTKLSALGKNGDRAFLQVAQSIINTEAPLRRNSKLLSEFTTALKNTARWQISSSVLHGFMGAVQSAYGYAQDLNESLNNIRIVTGANTDQMAAFAKEANNAAKALSTTTTAYTNAALIYYQQGNDDQTVLEKTDVTAKMANVTGQSAQVVSEQLTAIWNNFNKEGDKSYEHFADVLTALGAATASSTDEIAGGLEKFAGIADTIGLSYEYAASALATITATSRESEDVVGTALKTIFARIQGLNLGETLDDGTTLNKYSEALSKVGISIFEQNGELKNMDAILSEMGNKWETLNKDQQMALAQAVAGTRQYNQMMTLMDNWDFMEKNLATAAGSNGELQRQADIYAESWEASKARVKASLEEIYGTLIDDKFFISLNNGFAKIIDTVGKFADSIGGVKGVLLLLGNIATKIFGTEISNGINNMIQNIRNASGVAQQESSKLREKARDIALAMTKDMSSHEIDALRQSVSTTYEAQEKLLAQSKTMSKGQLEVAQNALRVAQGYNDEAIAAGKAADEARRLHEEQMKQSSATSGGKAYNKLNQYADNAVGQTGAQLTDSARNFIQTAKDMGIVSDEIAKAEGALKKYSNELRNGSQNSEKASKAANTLMQSMNKIIAGAEKSSQAFEKFKSKVNQAAIDAVEARSALDGMRTAISNGSFSGGQKEIEALITQLEKAGYDVGILRTNLDNLKGGTDYSQIFAGFVDSTESMNAAIARNANGAKKCTAEMEKLAESAGKAATQQKSAENSFKAAGDAADDASKKIDNVGLKYKTIGDAANGSLQGLSSFAMGLTSIKSAMNALTNPDLSTFEKFTSILMSMSMGIPSLVSSFKVFGDVLAFTTSKTKEGLTAELAHVLGINLETGAIIGNTGAKGANTTATGTNTVATEINTAAIWKSIAARIMEKAATVALVAVIGVALVGAIYLAVKAYNAESEAAKQAAKVAEEAANTATKVNNEYQNLISTLNELESGVDKIQALERGTLEWRQAIIESNNALIELLSTYGMLSSENFTVDSDGIMEITDKAKKDILEAQEKTVQMANSASYSAQVNKNNAENRISASEVAGELSLYRSSSDYTYDAMTGNSSLSADVGMAIGEALAQGSLNSDDLKNSAKLASILSEVNGLYAGEAEAIANQIAASDSLVNAFNELGISVASTIEANRILNNQIVEANFGDQINASGLSGKGQENVTNLMGSELEKRTQELYESTYKDKGALGGGKEDATIQKAYAEAMGWATDTIDNQSGNKAKYYNKDGSEIGVISDEVARRFLAQQAAIEEMGGNVQEYITTVGDLISVGNKIGDGVGEALSSFNGADKTGNLGNLNATQLKELSNNVSEIEDDKFTIGEGEDAIVVDKAYAEKLGYESVQAYYDAIQNEIAAQEENLDTDKLAEGMGITQIVDGVEKTYNTAGDAFKKLFSTDGLDLDEMTAGSKKAFADAYKSIFDEGGAEALTAVDELVTKAGDSASEVATLIGETDWSDVDSADAFTSKLRELGITIKDVDVNSFVEQMKEINGATKNFDLNTFRDEFTKINELAADIKFGDIISKEDFDSLGDGFDQYFTLMADGTYKMTGDAEAFYNAVMNQSRNDLLDSIKSNRNIQEENFAQYDSATSAMGENFNSGNIGEVQGDVSGAESQLNFIEAMGGANSDQLTAWSEALASKGEIAKEVFEEIAAAAQNCATEYNALGNAIIENDEAIKESAQAYLSSAQSIDEFEQSVQTLSSEMGADISNTDVYANALISLGSQYENCTEEIKAYQKALASGDSATIKAAKDALTLSARVGELSKKYDLNADVLETQVKLLKQNEKNAKLSEKQLVEMAAANQRMNKGIENLNKNWKTWSSTLKNSSKDSMDYAEALTEMTDALVEITGALDASAIPIDFFDASTESGAEHLDWMARAAEGDVQAINLLGNAVGEATINAMTFNEEIANLALDQGLFDQGAFNSAQEAFENYRSEVLEGVTNLQEAIKNGTLEAGQDITGLMNGTGQSWVDSLNQMALATGMSVDEMNSLLNQLGVQAKVDVTEVEQEMKVPTYTEYSQVSQSSPAQYDYVDGAKVMTAPPTWSKKTWTVPGPSETVMGTVQVAQISTEDGDVGPAKVSWTGTSGSASGGGVSPSSTGGGKKGGGGGGGGGGKSKPAEKTKKSEIVERYKEFEDQLDDTREEADKLKDSLDGLWGEELEQALERIIELENEERNLLSQKAQEAQTYLEEDKDALKKAAKDLNITFTFDADGNITDYTEEMTKLYLELADMEAAFGDEWSESEQEQIAALKEKIATLEEAMGDYEETRELLEDINIELEKMEGKQILPEVKSDHHDYFKETADELDDIEDAIERAQRNADRSTGNERLKYLQEILTLEQQRLLVLEQQRDIAQQVVDEQKQAMEELAARMDIEFEYDKNGNITNYDETIGALWDEYMADYERMQDENGKFTDAELIYLENKKREIEELTDLTNDYCDSVETLEDSVIALEEAVGDLPDPYVRADHMDIYKENRDQIDDVEEEIDDARRKADKLTGDARVKALQEVAKLEEKRLRLLKEQKAIAESEMEERKAAMQKIAERNGAVMAIDENGNVTNYIEVMDALLENYEYLANGGDDGLINDAERIAMEALEEDINELQEYIDAYCDAVETAEDIQNEIEDAEGYIDISNLDETIDKLHDIDNTLDEIQESLDDSSKAADRLYGSARIAQMQKTASLLQKEISALERKAEIQKEIIADEREELNMKASEVGTAFTYDDRGNITNYRAVMEAEKAQIEKMKADADADGNLTQAEVDAIEAAIEGYEALAEAVEEYEQALEDAEDIQNEIQDAFYEWQDLNAEMLSYELELKLQVNDRELAKIERAINRISDDFYQRAEAAAMMIGGGAGGSSQYSTYMSRLNELESQYNKVHQAYLAGEISQAAYVEQTRAIEAEIENVNASLESLQDTMDDYYKNTLAAARQELKFYTDQMSHLTGVLNHFKSILQALGKQNDYEMMDRVLRGQVETLENEVQVQKEAMALWKSQADQLYADYERELAAGNTENANMYYKAYQEALNAANEAENQYYAKAQQWANALKALMQNTLSDLAQDLENSLTGGTSFDTINTQLKRASSLQEEYLTTTNKIYETTKLMRTAQNEIDKTTNSVAKQKFANFINETKQLQNQNKLSKYELSIQQAKYDLLVAEIALEEARFAKSTVRLQRDSEGNFGYVYTANAEAVANAEQKFEDASNKLYNLALEGANKYVEKYQQTLSEMYDTLTSLQKKYLDGGFESEEEYNRAVLEAKEYYYAKLQDYSSLYQVAITTDSAVIADAWSTDFADMTEKTDQWMQAVNGYLDEVVIAFQEWERESDRIANETIGKDLDALEQNVKDITDRSEELVTQITDPANGVIKAISDELAAVKALTDQYASLRGEITGTIAANDALIDSMEKDIQASEEAEKGKVDDNQNNDPEIDVNDSAPEQSLPTDTPTDDSTSGEDTPPADDGGNNVEDGKVPDPTPLCSHDGGTTVETTAATCTQAGKKVTKCAKCGEIIRTEAIAKLGHDESGEWKHDKKNHWKVCGRCKEKVKKDAHKLKDGKCSVCGYKPNKKENKKLEIGDTPIYKSGEYYHDSYGSKPKGSRGQGKKVTVTDIVTNPNTAGGQVYTVHVKSNDSAYGWLKPSQLEGYDTGGYTGAWGSSGKLAMLHEKEIILNKDDTKNFLASLDLLDSILSTIDLHAMNSQFNTMINSPYVSGLAKEALQQNVSIEASFPNATDKKEIEEAFKDLVNLASQYTNRK